MYKIILDKDKVIQDSIDNTVISPYLKEKINSVPTLEYTIPYDDKYFDNYQRRVSKITVKYDDVITFKGRLLDDRISFDGNKKLTFEGELAFLNDIQYPPFEFEGDYINLFQNILDYYNSKCDRDKQFKMGQVTMQDPNNYITRSNENYSSCWNCITEKILKYGGYLKIRYIDDERYLDLLAESGTVSKQSIEFGKNLLDLEDYIDSSEIATVIIPLGAQKNDEGYEDGIERTFTSNRIDIRTVNDSKEYIESELVKKYGRIEKFMTWDDVTIPKNLFTKAKNELDQLILENQTITVKAIDLHFENGETPYYRLGDIIPIVSKPHKIDTTAILTERNRYLNNPLQDSFTLGTEKKTLTSSINDSSSKADEVAEKIEGNFLNEIIKHQTKLLANGKDGNVVYGYNNQGKLSEICFIDTNDINTCTNVIRFNNAGIGFSNTGYYGNYTKAWTIDGTFNTDFIKAFSINVNQLKSDVGQLLDISSNKAIQMLVEKIEKNTYKFEAGSGNIFDNCQTELSKDSTVLTSVIKNDIPLGIEKSFLKGQDICVSATIRVESGVVDNLSGNIGCAFDVTYEDGSTKTYSIGWHLGLFEFQYLLQSSTVDKNERIWAHFKLEDKDIREVSNMRLYIDLNANYASISNPKVEFGTEPTGFDFDLGYIRDNIEIIDKKYTVIKEDLDTVTIQAGQNTTSITTIKNDILAIDGSIGTIDKQITSITEKYTSIESTIETLTLKASSQEQTITNITENVNGIASNVSTISSRLDTAEISLQPTNILMAVNSQISDGNSITGVSFSIDKYGLHAVGGGFDITNASGTKVFYADGSGNLNIVGYIGAGSTINTNENVVVGNNIYVGQNQAEGYSNKYIYFTSNNYIRFMKLSSANATYLHANGMARIESSYQNYTTYAEANMQSVNFCVRYAGQQVNWFEVSNGMTLSQYQIELTSDIRMKHDIQEVDVSWIDDLKVKTFFLNTGGSQQIGLIAQDYLEKEYSKYFLGQGSNGYYSIAYGNITNALIKYCQQLKKEVIKANLEISNLKAQLGGTTNAIN